MKILITGINGFIGQYLGRALISKKHSVIGLGRQKKPIIKDLYRYFYGNILDKKIIEKAIKGAHVIIHLAALTSHEDIVNNKLETLKINLEGTKNILDVFLKSKTIKKFIYCSSGKVYGDIKFLPITEEHPTLPLNTLGKSKLITEKLIDFYANNKKSFIIFRIFNVFGPGQKDNFLIPTILNQIKKSNNITLGDIKAKRDYIYINDLINAFILAIEKNINPELSIFNICSGNDTNAKEIVSKISKIKHSPIKININPILLRKDEKNIEYGSYKKAKQILGWCPKYSIERGLKEIIKLSK